MFPFVLWVICVILNIPVVAQEEYINENNNLITIPTDVPSNVTILKLKNNDLQQLPQGSLDQFTNLEEIYLTSNLIETLENNVFNPIVHQNLSIISMGNNGIMEIPVLHGFKMLRILDLSDNELETIMLGTLDNLEELILNGNELHSLPVLMQQLPSLRTLILSHNRLVTESAEYFDKCPSLRIIDLSINSLEEITFGSLDALTEVRVSHNNLQAMPNLTQPLHALTKLVVNDNSISFIPEDYFMNTPSLRHLNLNKTKLTELECTRLNNLKNLYLDNTLLAQFPNITDCFTSLAVLLMRFIRSNFITPGIDKTLVFGTSLTPIKAPHLTAFHPRETYIGDFPAWFLYALPNLRNMDIAATKLTTMPDISMNEK